MAGGEESMIDIGFGLAIGTTTAEMVVVDEPRLDAGLRRSADPCDRAVAMLVTGDPGAARTELLAAEPSLRRDALLAEVARQQGDPVTAVVLLQQVLARYEPEGLRRAFVLQHLGKAEHAAGLSDDALAHLTEALALRRQHGAPPDQIASSELMQGIVSQVVAGRS